jgi:hypothetical protein
VIELSKDQAYGGLIFLVAIVVTIVYLIAFFGPIVAPSTIPASWYAWAIGLPVLLFVLLILGIAGWIGYVMLTTPPPAPLEPAITPETPATEESKPPA